jgi:glycosyltransferase involved in cell wall biosynthesis
VTVIVAARNEEANIARCLDQLLAQDYPHDRLEIIVADGMSTDRTRELVQSFATNGIPIRIVPNPGLGRAQGLNLAIQSARGDAIARVDARTVIGSEYLSQCIRALLETGAENVGGVQKPIANTPTQEAIGLALSHPFGVGNARFRLGEKSGYVDTVYLGCFRREVFDEVGLFDEEASVINEDSDMNQRIWEAGGKVYLDKDIVAHYYPRETFLDFWKLYFRYGGGRAGNFLKHGRLTSWRYIVAPLFILCIVGLTVATALDHVLGVPLIGLLGTYAVADSVVSFRLVRKQKKLALFPRLLLAFPCMHFAWALGFWKRLLIPDRPGTYWKY